MDSLFSSLSNKKTTDDDHPTSTKPHRQPSNSELFASAKVVADAAKSTLNHETDKLDKGKVAGAAEDLLDAASRYGKLTEKGYGGYVDKAENYLHQYSSTTTTTTTTTNAESGEKTTKVTHTETHVSGGDGKNGGGGGGGYGDYFKMAEGFLKK